MEGKNFTIKDAPTGSEYIALTPDPVAAPDETGQIVTLASLPVSDAGQTALDAKASTKVTPVNAATYTLVETDGILHVTYTATGAVTITIPTALVTANRAFTIKDAGGLSGTNNITIETEGSETFDGEADVTIATNYASVDFYSEGTNLFIR